MFTSRKARLLFKTLSPRKVYNFSRVYTSFHYSKLKRQSFHRGNPVKIGIEPTTACNLRCPECPSGLRSFTRPTGMIDVALYRQIIDQLAPDLVYLLLYFQGEPFLHPQFLDMAHHAYTKGIFSATSTNAHYLDNDRAKATVQSGLSEVIVSIDGTTQDTYAAYRKGGKLERVWQGLRNLIYWRQKLGLLHPHIVIQFLVVRHNEHQIAEIRRIGKTLGVDAVVLKTAQIYQYQQGHPLIPTNDRYSRYRQKEDGSYVIKNSLQDQCWKLWQGAEITWDGRVLPCCFDKDAKYEMGKLGESTFDKIWKNTHYQAFRNKILQSRKQIDICQNCSEGMKVWS